MSQYITGLEHAYLTTCVIALAAMLVSLFLPGWPGKYNPKGSSNAEAAPLQEVSGIA